MPTRSEAAADEALARSVIYHALALGLRSPLGGNPDALGSPRSRAALLEAARLLDGSRREAEPLLPAVERLIRRSVPSGGKLVSAHARLFGHAGGGVCPFETEYGPAGAYHQPQELADIAGCYLAFGLRPDARIDERVDHVACECEFMDFLARKEAFLLAGAPGSGRFSEAEREETLEAVRGAARSFLRDHLGRFGRAFAATLAKEGAGGFFGGLGDVLFRFLGLECERFAVAPGPPTLRLRPPVPDNVPTACGSCDMSSDGPALITLQRRRP
jgi:TorA maturation chaperone TorD